LSAVADLRLAEAVVHEAMHLNLTNLEGFEPLVASEAWIHSPWKSEPRPALGVLHGVYVFACIHRFFRHLCRFPLEDAQERYIKGRFVNIESEIASIDQEVLFRSLTPVGGRLAHTIFASMNV
jgi:HEXXH motif-containing protein